MARPVWSIFRPTRSSGRHRIPLRKGPHKPPHCPFIQRSLTSWVNPTVTTRHLPFSQGLPPPSSLSSLSPSASSSLAPTSPLHSRSFAAAAAACLRRQTQRSPMGCFLGCFGGAKEPRRRRKRSPSGRARQATPRLSPKKVALDGEVVSAAAPLLATLLELGDLTDDMCLTIVKKKVTFDPNVTTYEAAAIPEEADPAAGDDKDEARREKEWLLGPECAKSEAFPLDHRYSNCGDSDNESEYDNEEDEDEEDVDEEEDEDGIDECAVDDEEDDDLLGIGRGEEEACESLFLLPMSKIKERQQAAVAGVTAPEAATPCPTRDRSQYANPVLNSVENLTQRKEAKSRTATAAPKVSDKEIIMLGQENRMMDLLSEPAIPAKKKERPVVGSDYSPSTPSKQEVSVDMSLSTWLGSVGTPESNSVRSYSPISREDRPILGALTVEDIKISSANSSPRRSRSPSPDGMPILGTVGAYWNCSAKGGDPVNRGGFMSTRSRFGQVSIVSAS